MKVFAFICLMLFFYCKIFSANSEGAAKQSAPEAESISKPAGTSATAERQPANIKSIFLFGY